MVYLIIFCALALIVGPMLAILPSPAQRRQMQLRQQAMAKGLRVQLCALPQTRQAKVLREAKLQGALYRREWLQKVPPDCPASPLTCIRSPRGIEWLGDLAHPRTDLLQQGLLALPEDILALEYSTAGLGCFWLEAGDAEVIEIIDRVLHDVAQQLLKGDSTSDV